MLPSHLSVLALLLVVGVQVCSFGANAWEWNFLDDDPTDGLNIGLLQVRNIAADPWGSVCYDGFSDNEAYAACDAVGMPITSTGYVGHFEMSASDFSEYYPLVTVSCPTQTTPIASCTVTPWTTTPVCDSVALIDCSETNDTPAPTEAPITFDMKFSPTTSMTTDAFKTALKNAIVTHLTNHGITGVATSRILVQYASTYPNGAMSRFETRWQFTLGLPPHQELEEAVILDIWNVFPTSMNLTSFNDIFPPSPVPTTNTTGWSVRIYPNFYPWEGMLQVLTADPGAQWGTVCNDNFETLEPLSQFNLLAACHSSGYDTAAPGLLTNNSLDDPVREAMDILMDEVNCTAEDYYLTDCAFDYSPTGQFPSHDCSHTEDVYINCYMNAAPPTTAGNFTPGPEHDTPVLGWFAEVLVSGYTSTGNVTEFMQNFGYALAEFTYSPEKRVQFIDVTINGDAAFVSFRFTNATTTYDAPRSLLDSDLQNANAFTLKSVLNITFIWNNGTSSGSGSGNQDGNFFVSLSGGNQGIVQVRPTTGGGGSLPVSGTVCSINKFTKVEAHSFCLASGLAFDIAGAIPFHGGGTGPVYISDMNCHEQNILDFTNCSYTLTMPGDTIPEPDCTHDADAGAVCAFLTEAIPTASMNQDVITYTGILDVGMDLQSFYDNLNGLINLREDRFHLTEWTEGTTTTGAYISFFFGDNDEHDVGRLTYEYVFSHISQTQRTIGFTLTKQTQGKPAEIMSRHPFGWRDTTGWQYRLLDDQGVASSRGLFEVMPAGQTNWGTGCTTGFAMATAISICRTMGYPTDNAFAYVEQSPWAQGRPVMVDNIDCSEPNMQYFQNCTFEYYPAGEAVCENAHIYLDCSGTGPTTDKPVEFTAVVEQSRYPTKDLFQKEWMTYLNVTADRVDVSNPTTYGAYMYYTFRFLNNNQTNVDPSYIPSGISSMSSFGPSDFSVPSGDSYSIGSISMGSFSFGAKKQEVQDKTLAEADRKMLAQDDAKAVDEVLLPMPELETPKNDAMTHDFGGMDAGATGNLGDSMSEMSVVSLPSGWSQYIPMPNASDSWPMTNDPASLINTIVGLLHVSTVYDRFGIFEMWSNTTKPNGPVDSDKLTWTTRMVVEDSVNAGKVGRVEIQPGAAAMWGTVCADSTTPAASALDYCQQANASAMYTSGAIIPHFTEGNHVIYVSALMPDLSYTMSSTTQKKNDCTHMMDMGVLCNVGTGVSKNNYYLAQVVLGGYSDASFVANLAMATGVPASRIWLLNQVSSTDDDAMYVNFTFTDAATGLSRGDCELMIQYTNAWSMYKVANVRKIITTAAPIPPPTTAPTTMSTTATTATTAPTTATTASTTPTTASTTASTTATTASTTATTASTTATTASTTATTASTTATTASTTATTASTTPTTASTTATTATTASTTPTTASTTATTASTTATTASTTATTATTASTTPTTASTTATTAAPVRPKVNFELEAGFDSSDLQKDLNKYNGTVILPCTPRGDDTKTCTAWFLTQQDADSAMNDAPNMQGVSGASPEVVPGGPSADDDNSGPNIGAIVGGIIAAVVVVGAIVGFVVYKVRKESSYNEEDDYSGMNMALEDMSPEAMDDI